MEPDRHRAAKSNAKGEAFRTALLQACCTFYHSATHRQWLHTILTDPVVSIRLIEYFITHFASDTFPAAASFPWCAPSFPLATECPSNHYFTCLHYYTKRLFDPSCRYERIFLPMGNECALVTSLGQLNFFRWFFSCRVDAFMRDRLADIVSARRVWNRRPRSLQVAITPPHPRPVIAVHRQAKTAKTAKKKRTAVKPTAASPPSTATLLRRLILSSPRTIESLDPTKKK
jgi:hypothetical protein